MAKEFQRLLYATVLYTFNIMIIHFFIIMFLFFILCLIKKYFNETFLQKLFKTFILRQHTPELNSFVNK